MPVRSGRPRCANTSAALTTTVRLENDNGCKYSNSPDSGRTPSVARRGCCSFWGADMTDTTREIPFRDIPVEQRPLLLIASGVGVATALREAADLEDAVRRLLLMGTETGLDGGVAYLCEFALEIAGALRRSTTDE